jgi:hypothetical protein
MPTVQILNDLLHYNFQSISLAEVNSKAQLLKRRDNKYLVPVNSLLEVLKNAVNLFDVLTIHGEKIFAYSTIYYDDSDYQCYFDHHNGRRKRVKVRQRLYEQSDIKYLEIKLKSARKSTTKYRMPTQINSRNYLTRDDMEFIKDNYFRHYCRKFDISLKTSLAMRYFRFTLVGKHCSERVTIDSNLCFVGNTSLATIDSDQLIVEVKSKNGAGSFDKLLKQNGVRPKKRLSKYCIGMCLTDKPARVNKFLKPMRGLRYTTEQNSFSSINSALLHIQTGRESELHAAGCY